MLTNSHDSIELGIGDWVPNLQQAWDEANVTQGKMSYYPSGLETNAKQDKFRNDFHTPMIVRKLCLTWSGVGGGSGGAEYQLGGDMTERISLRPFLHRGGTKQAMTTNPMYNGGQMAMFSTFLNSYAEKPVWRLAAPFRVKKGESIYVEFGLDADFNGSFDLSDDAGTAYFVFHCVGAQTGKSVLWSHNGTFTDGRIRKSFRNVHGEDLFILALSTPTNIGEYAYLKVETSDGINWGKAEREITGIGTGWDHDNSLMEVLDFSSMPGGGQILMPGDGISLEAKVDITSVRYYFTMEAYVKRS